jgi:sulfonate transport system ATP-binding protein
MSVTTRLDPVPPGGTAVGADDSPSAPAVAPRPRAVSIRGLRKAFGGRVVLDGLDLEIARDEFVALLGASGTGKSTLLRILAGLDLQAEGEVGVAEQRAVVFQEPRLLPWKRVGRNVGLGLSGRELGRVDGALREVGLESHRDAWPATLSGGEAQRVALARALVREPELLLLDEPFRALDALTRIKMQALLADLCARHEPAVLLVTHDVDEALLLADRVLVLAGGTFSVDRTVPLPFPRRRTDPGFDELRHELLRALGVDDSTARADR